VHEWHRGKRHNRLNAIVTLSLRGRMLLETNRCAREARYLRGDPNAGLLVSAAMTQHSQIFYFGLCCGQGHCWNMLRYTSSAMADFVDLQSSVGDFRKTFHT